MTLDLEFKAPMTTLSGLKVSTLALTGEKYKPYKGVRCMLKSGRLQVRL
jgi:AP-3 complex subunit mu